MVTLPPLTDAQVAVLHIALDKAMDYFSKREAAFKNKAGDASPVKQLRQTSLVTEMMRSRAICEQLIGTLKPQAAAAE